MTLKYRSDIDGLRAFAVISVIIYHLNNHWLQGGFIGVDVFFVISGYLISKIIYAEIANNKFSFKNFYQRRINRILPVFFIVILFTSFFAWYILLPEDFMLFLRSVKSTTYFWENMFFAQNTGGYWDTSAESMPILHTWSLAVEEQFYILLPFILILLSKCKTQLNTKIVISIFIIIALISFTLSQISPKFVFLNKYNYYSLFTGRAGELLIGSIIGILSLNQEKIISNYEKSNSSQKIIKYNILTFIGFLGLILSISFISDKILFPSFWALVPTVSAALILYFYHPSTIISKLLSLKLFTFIGKISYSLYLWHWPVIVLTQKYLFIDHFYNAKQYIIVSIVTLILSILSYYFIEKPCRQHKLSFKFSFITYYLIPVQIIFGIYYIQKETKFLEIQDKKTVELYNLQKQYLDTSKNYCMGQINGNCLFGDTTQKPSMMLIGDSHSGHYSPYLDEVGKKYGFAIKIINAHSCTFFPEQIQLDIITPEDKETCKVLQNKIKDEIQNVKIIIYAARYDGYHFNDGKKEYLLPKILPANIDKIHKKFIVLAQVPWINELEREKFMTYFLYKKPFQSNNFLTGAEKNANELVKKSIQNKAIFFNPLNDLDENSKKEWPIYKGLIAYSYDSHLNEYVTRQWSQEVLPKQKAFWEELVNEANK